MSEYKLYSNQVVDKPSQLDTTSWPTVAAEASPEQVLLFIHNESPELYGNELHRILWRLKDATFFEKLVAALHHRGIFDETVWCDWGFFFFVCVG